jgi:pimeloyl-ACP methyl ester carboxylesterase
MSKRGVPDALIRQWLAPLARREIRRDYRKYAGDVRRGKRDLLAATEALKAFDRPVLVVWAGEDRLMPLESGRRLVETFPNARLVEIADSYTLIPEDQPVALAALVRELVVPAHRAG